MGDPKDTGSSGTGVTSRNPHVGVQLLLITEPSLQPVAMFLTSVLITGINTWNICINIVLVCDLLSCI